MKKTILAGVMATLFVPATYANANDIVEVPITNVQPNYSVSEVRVPVNNCNQQLVPRQPSPLSVLLLVPWLLVTTLTLVTPTIKNV